MHVHVRFTFGGENYGVKNTVSTTNNCLCVHVHRKAQSKRGGRKRYQGVRLPYAVVLVPRH